MIDPDHFDRVRIVQDMSIEKGRAMDDTGTKVLTDIFDATQDSYSAPSALGYNASNAFCRAGKPRR